MQGNIGYHSPGDDDDDDDDSEGSSGSPIGIDEDGYPDRSWHSDSDDEEVEALYSPISGRIISHPVAASEADADMDALGPLDSLRSSATAPTDPIMDASFARTILRLVACMQRHSTASGVKARMIALLWRVAYGIELTLARKGLTEARELLSKAVSAFHAHVRPAYYVIPVDDINAMARPLMEMALMCCAAAKYPQTPAIGAKNICEQMHNIQQQLTTIPRVLVPPGLWDAARKLATEEWRGEMLAVLRGDVGDVNGELLVENQYATSARLRFLLATRGCVARGGLSAGRCGPFAARHGIASRRRGLGVRRW
jgi:hypothetical protein